MDRVEVSFSAVFQEERHKIYAHEDSPPHFKDKTIISFQLKKKKPKTTQ